MSDNWDNSRIFALNLPTGLGKSAIAITIQRTLGAHIITPQNTLIDQYRDIYKDINYLKGKQHYYCQEIKKLRCVDAPKFGFDCIKCQLSCPLKQSRNRATRESTLFNPMSLYYNLKGGKVCTQKVFVVDEAHSLISFLKSVFSHTFSKTEYNYTDKDIKDEISIANWLRTVLISLERYRKTLENNLKEYKRYVEVEDRISGLKATYDQFTLNPQDFVYSEQLKTDRRTGRTSATFVIQPILLPRDIVLQLLPKHAKVILVSGTLLSEDIKELVRDEEYKFFESNSPIPVENRKVFYSPIGNMNYMTPIETYYKGIKEVLEKTQYKNTIIHLTYSLQKQLVEYLKSNPLPVKVHHNSSDDKTDILSKFTKEGGVFLASGCSEGLDLIDNIARVNIICKLDYANLMDLAVQKRKSLENGDLWYAQETIKLVVQRAGRTTRHAKDYSETYILDSNFINLYQRYQQHFPKYFRESIVWTKE